MTRWPCFLGNQCFNHLYLFFFIFLFHLCVVGLEWPDRSYPGGGRGAVCKVTSRRRNKCDTWIKVITAYYCNILQPFLSFQILLTSTIQLNQLEDIWIYTIIYIFICISVCVYNIYVYVCVFKAKRMQDYHPTELADRHGNLRFWLGIRVKQPGSAAEKVRFANVLPRPPKMATVRYRKWLTFPRQPM